MPDKDDRWSDVESSLQLGKLNRIFLDALDAYQITLSEEDPGWDDSRFFLETKTHFIKNFAATSFHSWLASINLDDAAHEVIFNKDALFITFNYTRLLEKRYEISDNNILHIHGAYNMPDDTADDSIFETSKLQFGSPENDAKRLRKTLERACADDGCGYPDDYHYGVWIEPCIQALEQTCQHVEKRLSENYSALKQFLLGKTFHSICVFGHSYNQIDYPYYRDILIPAYRNLPWTLVDYGANKKSAVKSFCFKNGISRYEAVDDYGIEFLDLSHLPLLR